MKYNYDPTKVTSKYLSVDGFLLTKGEIELPSELEDHYEIANLKDIGALTLVEEPKTVKKTTKAKAAPVEVKEENGSGI